MAPAQYLTRKGIAELLGIKHTTVTGYDERGLLPEPDVMVGHVKGWSEQTILDWKAKRPGRGHRSDLAGNPARSKPAPKQATTDVATKANTEPATASATS